MAKTMMWQGGLKPVPPEVRDKPPAVRAAAMQQKFGHNNPPYPPPGFGREMMERRKRNVWPKLDKLPSPPPGVAEGKYKGLKVYTGDGTQYGRANGTTFPCSMEGCRGSRVVVVWSDGKMSYPCGKGLVEYKDGWRINDGTVSSGEPATPEGAVQAAPEQAAGDLPAADGGDAGDREGVADREDPGGGGEEPAAGPAGQVPGDR